jgi:peptidyl-prolyl cis-trans isomerase A (cyclophilin A)
MRRLSLMLMVTLGACSTEKSGDKPLTTPSATGRVALLVPGSDKSSMTAPDSFKVRFETTKGNFVMQVHRDWAPSGADRFYYLAKNGFYDDTRFFRAVENFMVQFGLSGDPKLSGVWRDKYIYDDSVKQSNHRGFVTYAKGGANTRTTQLFINYKDNGRSLDGQGFAPFGQVVEGMEVVDQLFKGYGDSQAAGGKGPDQTRIRNEGNTYLDRDFPKLDKIVKTSVIEESKKPTA